MNAPVTLRSSHDAMVKRIRRFARDLPDEYKGSRTASNRYLYKNTNLENFIELKEDGPDVDLLRDLLAAVKGVRCVTAMGDFWAVFSHQFPDEKAMKFLFSSKNHVWDECNPKTSSACYTRQPDNTHALEAWRILREAVRGWELNEKIVDQLDIELREAFRAGSASSSVSFSPPWEVSLAHDIADAYALKLSHKKKFKRQSRLGMAQMPSNLAIRSGLPLFRNAVRGITHNEFKHSPRIYESSAGMVYCDAGNGIYARIFQKMKEAVCKFNPSVQHVCTKKAQGDLIEVVLHQYRHNMKSNSWRKLSYLESMIQGALEAVHGDSASGSANASEGEEDSEMQSESETEVEDSDRDFKFDMQDQVLMQRFKCNATTTVRWRSLPMSQDDAYQEVTRRVMLDRVAPFSFSLWEHIWHTKISPFEPCERSATTFSETCRKFLQEARLRCLAPKFWEKSEEVLRHKESFLSDLPLNAVIKYEGYVNDHCFVSRYHAVCGLLDLHRGEVVEVPSDACAKWRLFHLPCLSRGEECLPDQFALGPHYRAPKLTHFDKQIMRHDIKAQATWTTQSDLEPDQVRSRNRMFMPCRGTTQWAWVRAGNVITLGELFHGLFHQYTSREIYDFYLSLDILAVKQKKIAPRSRKRRFNQT